VVPIRVPPLRERAEDIPMLVQHFFHRARAEGLPQKTVEPAAMARLKAYPWPGNVRELENLVRRLAVLYAEETIGAEVIEAELREVLPVPGGVPGEGGELVESIARHLDRLLGDDGGRLPPPGLHARLLRELERPLISRVLAATRGNQLRAAAVLGLNRNTLRKKIRELDIEVLRGPR
jgi:two-component system, NtrC family, nitrogen regulation response regulator GlnG